MQVPTNSTCLNWTKPKTMFISLLKFVSWSWLNFVKTTGKPFSTLFSSSPGLFTQLHVQSSTTQQHLLRCKEKKNKNNQPTPQKSRAAVHNFPGQIETKEPSPDFTWPLRPKDSQTQWMYQHRAELHRIKYLWLLFHHWTWNKAWLNLFLNPLLSVAMPAKLSSQQQQKQNAWTYFQIHMYFSFFSLNKGRSRKCKGNSSWSNLPSSQLGHYRGWDRAYFKTRKGWQPSDVNI